MAVGMNMIQWMQDLSDATRTRILRVLERHELSVAELCGILRLPQSTVSRHLKLLAQEGWVQSRKDGTTHWYRMRPVELEATQRRLWQLVREHGLESSLVDKDDSRLEQVLADRRSRGEAFITASVAQWDRIREELFGSRIDAWVLAALADENQVVGDLGCGTGALCQLLAPWVHKVIGVDRSAAMLQSARKRCKLDGGLDLRRGELGQLPIDDDELSSTLLVLALPYSESPLAVIREASRATKSGGKLVILDMQSHTISEYRERYGHHWLGFSEGQMRDWLAEAGWSQIRWFPVPVDPSAKGPPLFLSVAINS